MSGGGASGSNFVGVGFGFVLGGFVVGGTGGFTAECAALALAEALALGGGFAMFAAVAEPGAAVSVVAGAVGVADAVVVGGGGSLVMVTLVLPPLPPLSLPFDATANTIPMPASAAQIGST